MKIKIDDYRGWSIEFDNEKESFYCHSEQYDRDETKKSYSSVKKFVDDFIKDNFTFPRTKIQSKPSTFKSTEILTIVGIRKDERFVYEDKKGNKHQLPDYYENDYILYNEENDKHYEYADKLQEKINQLTKEKKETLNNVVGVELVDFKKQLLSDLK